MKHSILPGLLALTALGTTVARAGSVTTYNNSGAFDAAIGVPVSVEDFTSTYHFPLPGPLNSSTNLPGIGLFAGDILPGVNYTVPVYTGNDIFNIDGSGGYTGGFLDGLGTYVGNAHEAETTTFDALSGGFAFFTNDLMGAFTVTVNFDDGPSAVYNYDGSGYYGFVSSSADITSMSVIGSSTVFNFDFDNFTFPTYGGGGGGGSVPDTANTLILIGVAFLGFVGLRRRIVKA